MNMAYTTASTAAAIPAASKPVLAAWLGAVAVVAEPTVDALPAAQATAAASAASRLDVSANCSCAVKVGVHLMPAHARPAVGAESGSSVQS